MGYTPPSDIDIGNTASDRANTFAHGSTCITKNNPANASGTITSIEIWANTNLTNVEVATFYVVSGNNLSTRDTEAIGGVTGGSKQTFEVNLDVQEGDFLGIYYTSGDMEVDTTAGGDGLWWKSGDYVPCTNQYFNWNSGHIISLYGTGTAPGELTIGEALSIVDSKVTNISKALGEALSIVDSKVTNISKALSEAFSVVDSWRAKINLAEAFAIADSLVTSGKKALTEAVSVVDTLVTSGTLVFVETLSIVMHNWRKLRCAVLAWVKEDDLITNWTKKDNPTTEWERKD